MMRNWGRRYVYGEEWSSPRLRLRDVGYYSYFILPGYVLEQGGSSSKGGQEGLPRPITPYSSNRSPLEMEGLGIAGGVAVEASVAVLGVEVEAYGAGP